ncbi:type II secretion system protein (plasmid) [Photobacterium damselae]|uniref:type II secretion system protein n=1 Tax=Photobacterium damselae TaxID=38293 RepID=UPI002543BE15
MKKQKGFGLIETIMALAILGIMSTFIIQGVNKYNQIKRANAYADQIERVITQLQKYQYKRVTVDGISPSSASVWPTNLDGLMVASQFWPSCSLLDEQAHRCVRPDSVPWTTRKLGYAVTHTNPTKAELTIPAPPPEWVSPLKELPFAVVQHNGDIKVAIEDPLLSQVFDDLQQDWLKKDGSTELTKTWDVGNQAILNTERVTVRTQAGTQLRIDAGTVKEFLARHGDRIYKSSWSCPKDLRQTIYVNAHAPMAPRGYEYIGISNFKPYAIDRGSYYELNFDYNAKIKSTGEWKRMHSGFLNVRLNCDQ